MDDRAREWRRTCELLLCSPSYPDGMRYMAFVLLIMIWASLRADDTQNIEPVSVRLGQIGLRFVLKRTKTSGAGRKVGELHAFISRVAGVSGYDWLLVGMRLREQEEFSWGRDFLCPVFSMNWEADSRAYLDPSGAWRSRFAHSCRSCTSLKRKGVWRLGKEFLLPEEMGSQSTPYNA